jgi:hypothetical protein
VCTCTQACEGKITIHVFACTFFPGNGGYVKFSASKESRVGTDSPGSYELQNAETRCRLFK